MLQVQVIPLQAFEVFSAKAGGKEIAKAFARQSSGSRQMAARRGNNPASNSLHFVLHLHDEIRYKWQTI